MSNIFRGGGAISSFSHADFSLSLLWVKLCTMQFYMRLCKSIPTVFRHLGKYISMKKLTISLLILHNAISIWLEIALALHLALNKVL